MPTARRETWQIVMSDASTSATGGEPAVNERNSRVARALSDAGVEAAIRILDADAKTAVAAAAQLGCEVGAIANSLVFDCDGAPLRPVPPTR
jgi:hypothetical protein